MKKKGIGLLLMASLLTGCGGSSSVTYDPDHFVDYYISGQDFETLNYLTSMSARDLKVIANIMDGMVETDLYGQVVPCLAESWEHNEDYTVWTFYLREGLEWVDANGKIYDRLTADDFVYSAEYVLDPQTGSNNVASYELIQGARAYYEAKLAGEQPDSSMIGIKALDERTVQYTMAGGGCPYFPSVLGYSAFYPTSRRFVSELTSDDPNISPLSVFGNSKDTVLYCGAFILQEHQLDTERTLVRNTHYWDKANVHFETVKSLAVKDEESVVEYFERGEVSYAPLVNNKAKTEYDNGNQNLVQKDTLAMTYALMFNNQTKYSEDVNTAMSNEDFRKSIYYGFDREMFIELINPINPSSLTARTFTASGYLYTEEGTDYTQLDPLQPYQSEQYQPDQAASYKQRAMDTLQAQGVQFPLELRYYYQAGNETAALQARMLQEILETNLGTDYITVSLHEYSRSFVSEARSIGDYALAIGGWNPDFADPINNLTCLRSDGTINNAYAIETLGNAHFAYPEFDAMLEEANAITSSLKERYTAFAKAEAYLLEHAYLVPIYVSGGTYELTTVNNYSHMHSKVGIDQFKYKGLIAYDHVITASENEAFKQEWENAKPSA